MKVLSAVLLAGLLAFGLLGASPGRAQESPSQTWNGSAAWRSAQDRQTDVYTASAEQEARSGGFGPGSETVNFNGPVTNNSQTTNNGPVSNASALNAVNYTNNSASVQAGQGANAVVHFQTGSTSYQASQNAQATNQAGQTNTVGTNQNNQP